LTSVDWLEVRLRGSNELLGFVDVALQNQGFPGWVDESAGEGFDYLLYLPQEPGWQERLAVLQRTCSDLGAQLTTHGQVRDEDWAENWKRFYHPLQVGKHLVVCPSWETYAATPDQKVVILDPGSAFGTGYHWSTRLCLEFLEEVEPCGPVLDLGTGSGILAIAAHKLGFGGITALDNDPVAVKVAAENVQVNGIDSIAVGLADSAPAGPFALITANLIASLLVEMAASLAGCLARGGKLICGGIIRERRDEVVDAFRAQGLELLSFKEQEDWVSLLLVRP
jgi:ribosomal protein L11 methyltransferase